MRWVVPSMLHHSLKCWSSSFPAMGYTAVLSPVIPPVCHLERVTRLLQTRLLADPP